MKKIKVFGDFVYPRCIRVRGGGKVCKPAGKSYKFRSYRYIWVVDDKALDKI